MKNCKKIVAVICLLGMSMLLSGCSEAEANNRVNGGTVLASIRGTPIAIEFRTSTGVLCVGTWTHGAAGGTHVTCDWNNNDG